jgi:hypothetical protein
VGVDASGEPLGVPPTSPPRSPDFLPPTRSPVLAPARTRTRNRLIVIGIVALVLVLVLAAAGFEGNSLLSSRYSPERAVADYFAAQSRGDVSAMMANGIFEPGANVEFFNRSGVAAMMAIAENKDVRNVRVVSSKAVDASTRTLGVSMTWAGVQLNQTYTVRRDNSQTHVAFYHSWRIVIPFVTIHITLPNQPGSIEVDGISPAASDTTSIQTVQGYHQVAMVANFLYDSASQLVNGTDGDTATTFASGPSASAVSRARVAVNAAFKNCDSTKYTGCMNHLYSAPNDGRLWYFVLPGYGNVYYTTYQIALAGDPTDDMKLDVPTDAGKVNASGTCKATMTINGSKNYSLMGPWTGVLTWATSGFGANLESQCTTQKA